MRATAHSPTGSAPPARYHATCACRHFTPSRVPPTPPLLLASISPQRRAILEQLRIPFEVVAPSYVETDAPGVDPRELVERHAEGKARSVTPDERLVIGVDTAVVLDRWVYGKPAGRTEAEEMLRALSGQTHTVVTGLCLLGPDVSVRKSEWLCVLIGL